MMLLMVFIFNIAAKFLQKPTHNKRMFSFIK